MDIRSLFGSNVEIISKLGTGLVGSQLYGSLRSLVLLKNGTTHSLTIVAYDDTLLDPAPFLERVFPVATRLVCEIRANEEDKLELASGDGTNQFAGKLFQAIEENANLSLTAEDFNWAVTLKPKIAMDVSVFVTSTTLKNVCVEETIDALEEAVDALSIQGDVMETTSYPTVASEPRETLVTQQMSLRKKDFTNTIRLKLFVGTYNVNGKSPTTSLSDWLSCDDEPPDMYAIGFQELYLSKEAYVFMDTPKEEEWLRTVLRGIHPKAKYRKVKLIRLVGIMLIVLVQERFAAYIRGVSVETVGTGFLGKMGNKGGVGVRFELHSTSVCIVNCHLAAQIKKCERRNQDYHDICTRMSFPPAKTIKDHDLVFWFGDLNYRLTGIEGLAAKNLLDTANYKDLIMFDQLREQQRIKRAFYGYQEGILNFQPTYKYDTGTDNWDSSEKNRAPAWTDRILWKADDVDQIVYRSHPSLRISDHKPVSSLFEIPIAAIDIVKYKKIYEEVMKHLDRLENDYLPQIAVSRTEIDFGTVRFLENKSNFLTISNTGQVPLQYKFINKLREENYSKPWLIIEPHTGFLMPGDYTEIQLEIYVDKRTAGKLSTGQDTLQDILVLHLEGGKDLFISVIGSYEPSCFGSSIGALVRLPQPIRDYSAEEVLILEKRHYHGEVDDWHENNRKSILAVPKEMWFLLDELTKQGTEKENLFELPGLGAEISVIRDILDTSMPDNLPGSIHSVGEALLVFLDALPEPVIPVRMYAEAMEASSTYLDVKKVVARLPGLHRRVFHHLVAFLRELLVHSLKNKLEARSLAAIFGSVLLRDGLHHHKITTAAYYQSEEKKKADFLLHFLTAPHWDWIE
ncbi:type II inositol 1,4,5-trisphosphate 5-phosphatase-like [Artemia franciscana]|uniref:type II inositol 1,4,5-trisphosphate 5-phosphatase-like n=1 Tax=Artemia franciscana TaxID=6661 RepID=UPI0032DB2AF4